MKLSVQTEDFDLNAECAAIARGRGDIGALASFVGLVRDINRAGRISGMTLEHYPGMTERSLAGIVEQARARWQIIDVTVIHRIGPLQPGDNIVLVIVAGAHRGEAFAACEFIMDYLKTRAPFWKKEDSPQGSIWVDAREEDDRAAQKWGV